MNFRFTEEQEALRAAFKDFVKQEVEPNAVRWDEEDGGSQRPGGHWNPSRRRAASAFLWARRSEAVPENVVTARPSRLTRI